MFKILLGFIFKIRDVFQRKFGQMFERFRDKETGKIKFARPKTIKKVMVIGSIAIFFLIFLSKLIGGDIQISGGLESYEKELKPSTGVGLRNLQDGGRENDPFRGLGNITRDQYGADVTRSGDRFTGIYDADGNLAPPLAECVALIDKLKANQTLSADDQEKVNACLEKNEMGLTADELAFAKAMLDPNTTAAERELLAKVLSGKATPEELAVARALTSGTPEEKAMARAAIVAGEEAIRVLGKSLDGRPLTEEEQALLDKIKATAQEEMRKQARDAILRDTQATLESGQKVDFDPLATSEALKAASIEIAKAESEVAALEEKLRNQQLRVTPILEKLAEGKQITAAENKLLEDFAKARAELENLKKAQEKRKTDFARRVSKAQSGLAQAVTTVQGSLPTGSFIEYEGEPFNCDNVKSLVKKKPRAKVVAKKAEKVIDLDGRELRPEEVEFIKLHRKQMYELSQAKKEASNPDLGNLGRPINLAGADGEMVGIQDLQNLVVFKDQGLGAVDLSGVKIPAVLESQILVSDRGQGQMVRARVLADVHNPRTNQILIPKGSLVIGMTAGFDAETGLMNISFDKVNIGSGRSIEVRLTVGSADGSMGLKGRVHDPTGKYLLGAFVTSFSAGALGWFSQQVVAPYTQSTVAGQALTGAGLAGSADVMTKISELYAGKLQNASKVFWAPKSLPIVLFAN